MMTDRVATMGSVDEVLSLTEKKVRKRDIEKETMFEREQKRVCDEDLNSKEAAMYLEDDPTNDDNLIDETGEMPPPERSHKRTIKKGTDGFWSHNILKHPSVVARAVRNKVTPTAFTSITESLI